MAVAISAILVAMLCAAPAALAADQIYWADNGARTIDYTNSRLASTSDKVVIGALRGADPASDIHWLGEAAEFLAPGN